MKKLIVFVMIIGLFLCAICWADYLQTDDEHPYGICGYEFNATQVDQIKGQMYTQFGVDMTDLNNYDTITVYNSIKQMYATEPELTLLGLTHLKEIRYMDESRTNAYAYTYMEEGIIMFNPKYFQGECNSLKVYYNNDVRLHYHPRGTDFTNVFLHEFGHIIDGALMVSYARYDYETYDVVFDAYYETPVRYRSIYTWQKTISLYATANYHETVAEAWSEYIKVSPKHCSPAAYATVNSLRDAYFQKLLESTYGYNVVWDIYA